MIVADNSLEDYNEGMKKIIEKAVIASGSPFIKQLIYVCYVGAGAMINFSIMTVAIFDEEQ